MHHSGPMVFVATELKQCLVREPATLRGLRAFDLAISGGDADIIVFSMLANVDHVAHQNGPLGDAAVNASMHRPGVRERQVPRCGGNGGSGALGFRLLACASPAITSRMLQQSACRIGTAV